ncbi:hypothetical protein ACKQTC_00125 [Peptococcus simiae]|uniref:Uncharacterized protein n=1 Tax=Peptococcus simiae TaxID=1643805 RepID=A0ABW9GVK0_9FIRM
MQRKKGMKRIIASLLTAAMLAGLAPLDAQAAIPADPETQGGIATRALEPADWSITDKNQDGKNYWPLTHNNKLRTISGVAEGLKTPTINYNGYFTRPDGKTVLRLSYRQYHAATTAVWHTMLLKIQDELAGMIDFNDQGTGIYYGVSGTSGTGWKNDSTDYTSVTQFGKEDTATAGSNNVYSVSLVENHNRATARASNEIPINLVLKDGLDISKLSPKNEQYLVQMRLTDSDKKDVYTDGNLDNGDSQQAYNSYTFGTTIGVKSGFDKGLLRYLEPSSPHYHSSNSTIHYNMEQGYVEVRHHFNREGLAAGQNPNGFPIGYRQVVDKSFYDTLRPVGKDGTVAYMYQMLSNGALNNAFNDDGTIENPNLVQAIKKSDLNDAGDGTGRAFLQVVASDFNTEAQYKDKIVSVKTSNRMNDIFSERTNPSTMNYGHGIIIRYYVDKEKLANTFAEGNNLSHSAFYSTFIYDNSKEGTDTFDFTLSEDLDLKAGDKIHVRFDQPATDKGWVVNTAGQSKENKMMIYVDGPGNKMELRSNFKVDRGTDHRNYTYTVQAEAPMKLKKGTKLTLAVNKGVRDLKSAEIYFNNNSVNPPLVDRTAKKVTSYVPLIPDWQDTLSAGTLVATDFKPEIDEIFTDDNKIEGSTYYIGAEIKMVDKDRTQKFEASRDQEKVKVGGKEYDGYRFTTPISTAENKFIFPTLEKDTPILFTNRDIEHMALESKPEVVEQVQTKVFFHHNNGTRNKAEDVTTKIVPLNAQYRYNFKYNAKEEKFDYTANAKYQPNGFLGYKNGEETTDNLRKVTASLGGQEITQLADHNGRALTGDALKLRQMPVTTGEGAEVTKEGKKFLGWSTKKNTTPEEFMAAQELTTVDQWKNASTTAYKFTGYSPVDTHRPVYAVWGDLSVILHHPSGDASKNIILPITEKNIVKEGTSSYALVNVPEVFYSHANSSNVANKDFAYRYDKVSETSDEKRPNTQTQFIGWQLGKADGSPNLDKVKNGEHLTDFLPKTVTDSKEFPLTLLQDKKGTPENEAETAYLPNTYKLRVDGNLDKMGNIDLYPVYRDYAKIRLHKQYTQLEKDTGEFVSFTDKDKQHEVKFGLLYRTYVTDWNDPTVAAAANYYTINVNDFGLTEDTLLPTYNPKTTPEQTETITYYPEGSDTAKTKEVKYHVSWMLPVYDKYGERLSYAAVEVKPGEEDKYKNFSQKWENLSVNVYDRFPSPDDPGKLVAKGPRGPEDDGKGLPKTQTISFDRGNEVDTFTAATYRDTVSGATPKGHAKDKFLGYQIRAYNIKTDITTPDLDPIYDGDTKLVINYKNKMVDKVTLKIGEFETETTKNEHGTTQKDTPKDTARTVTLEKQGDGSWQVTDTKGAQLKATLDGDKLTVAGFNGAEGSQDLDAEAKPTQKVFAQNHIIASGLHSEFADFKINPLTPAQAVVNAHQITRDADYNTRIEMKVPKLEAGPLNEPQRGNAKYQLLRLIEDGMTPIEQANTFEEGGKTYEKIGAPAEYTDKESLIFTIPKADTGDENVSADIKDLNVRDEEASKIKETDKFYIQSIETAKPSSISAKPITLDLTGANVTAKAEDDKWRFFIDLVAQDLKFTDRDDTNIQKVHFKIGDSVEEVTTDERFAELLSALENDGNTNMDNVRIVVFDKYGNKSSEMPAYNASKVIVVEADRPVRNMKFASVKAPLGAIATVNVYDNQGRLVAKGEQENTTDDFENIKLYIVDDAGEMTTERYKAQRGHRFDYKAVMKDDPTAYSNPMSFTIN